MSDQNRDEAGQTTIGLFDRLVAGDKTATEDLLIHFNDRLRRLTKKMFGPNERLRGLHETGDIEQGAAMRLIRAIEQTKPKPATKLHFMRLAAECVRRELIDLSRKEYGPQGDGKRVYANRPLNPAEQDELMEGHADSAAGPQTQAARSEFHEKVRELPAPELEVFELIHYGGHTHDEVAAQLGVSASTVKRRWLDAQESLHALLRG